MLMTEGLQKKEAIMILFISGFDAKKIALEEDGNIKKYIANEEMR
ncbi:hypothetical protein [Serratia marcescens]|nr:hypothetical protein [Serratia marcescens]